VVNGKMTLPLIYSLRNGEKSKSRETLKLLGDGINKESFQRILKYVKECGGIDYAYRRAGEIAQEGLSVVQSLNKSGYYNSLLGMVDYSISRAG